MDRDEASLAGSGPSSIFEGSVAWCGTCGELCVALDWKEEEGEHLILGNVSCHILRKISDKGGKNPRQYKEGSMRQSLNTHSIYSMSSGATGAMLSKKPNRQRWKEQRHARTAPAYSYF